MRIFYFFSALFMMMGALAETKVREVGLEVGSQIPEFSLPDQNGIHRNIQELVGPNGAVIDFYRSAEW